ncbi:hypothetical protein HA466_0025460 [Hirschfeldia incana]|nr:hypothetical protein HA466_0025460 [Hirschfeldia incana]
MASASSSAARLLMRDGKSVASLLLRGRAANLKETGPAIRSLLLLNQTVPSQYPVFSETLPVMKPGFGSYFTRDEAVSVRRGKMEAGQGKRVVNNEGSSSSEEEEEETDFDDEEFDDIDMDDDDEEFDDTDEEDDDDEEEGEKKELPVKKKK